MSCEGSEQGSELMRHATPESSTSNLVRVRDGSRIDFVMVSGNKGYKLACENPGKLNKLIEATGYPPNLVGATEVLSRESDAYLRMAPDEQPVLGCQPVNKILYRADLDGSTKYFFSEPEKSRTRLYMFGCQALVDAMGFQLADATELSPSFIEDLGIFSVADEDDISCVSGVTVGAGVTWKNGSNIEKLVEQGSDIGFTSYEALLPNGSPAPLTISAEAGRCDWIQRIFLGSGLLVTGQAPADFYNQSCELTITAAANTPVETSLTFKVATAQVKPVISTDCALTQKLSKAEDFRPCTVGVDKGSLTMNIKPAANCVDIFKFDPSTGKLELPALPRLGVSCEAEFSAELNGVVSDSKSVAIERTCAVGTRPNSTGTCDVIMCDAVHKYQDTWTVPSNESHGNRLMYCNASGVAEDRGLGACFTGYEKRSGQCLRACAAGFLEGDLRRTTITNGSLTEVCSKGDISKVISCNANALLRGSSCLLTCDKVHVDGNTWDVSITNGTQKHSCDGTTLKKGAITCSSGYLLRSNSCKVACDTSHAAGDEWFVDIANGKRKNLCQNTGKVSATITCNAGYLVKGDGCSKAPPPAPKKCGIHAHGSTWTETVCNNTGEYQESYQCDNGNKKLKSSRKVASICR